MLVDRRKTHTYTNVKVKVAHTRLPSVRFNLQVTWVINPALGCHHFPPGMQLPISLLGEQRHNGCEQFAWECYQTSSQLRFEPRPFWAWVQHANHSTRLSSHPSSKHPARHRILLLVGFCPWWVALSKRPTCVACFCRLWRRYPHQKYTTYCLEIHSWARYIVQTKAELKWQ